MKYDYDLFVIGAGSGGVRAARIASQAGARVAVAEEYRIGGTCVIRGCVPKKFLVYGAEFSQMLADAAGYGWTVRCRIVRLGDAARQRAERGHAALGDLHQQSRQGRSDRLRGTRRGRRRSHREAQEVRQRMSAEANPRSRPAGAPIYPKELPGFELGITSNEAFLLEKFPRRVLIVGGGYVALEFANIFHGLGAEDAHRASRRQAAARLRRRPARAHAHRSWSAAGRSSR